MSEPADPAVSERSDSAYRFSWRAVREVPRYTYLIAATAALGGLLFGYDIGVIAGAEGLLKTEWRLSPGEEELAVAAVLFGSIAGGAVGGKMADALSRRYTLLIMAVIYAVGAVTTALAPDLWWFFAFRVLTGIAVGASSLAVPMYIAEMAPVAVRGGLVILQQLAISGGILVSYIVDYVVNGLGWGWRPMFAAAVFPAVVLAVGMLYLDHSPRWLAMRNRWDEAAQVMSKINPAARERELELIEHDLRDQGRSSWRELFAPGLRGALIAGVGLAVFQQFVGSNTVLFYTPTIFRYAGIGSHSDALVSTIYVGIALFVFVFGAIALVDLLGRKTLFYIGLGGMCAMLIVFGLLFHLGAQRYGTLLLIAMLVYVACYSLSISPLFWLMSAEVFPNRLRAAGAGWSTVANWSANLIISVSYLTAIEKLGKDYTYWLYALVAVAAIAFVKRCVPETKGRPLEYIEDYWRGGRVWPANSSTAADTSPTADR
jgi:MFS transporter, SP family, galactose:H+ symporter